MGGARPRGRCVAGIVARPRRVGPRLKDTAIDGAQRQNARHATPPRARHAGCAARLQSRPKPASDALDCAERRMLVRAAQIDDLRRPVAACAPGGGEKLYNSTVGRFSAAAICTSPVSTPTVAAAPSISPATAGSELRRHDRRRAEFLRELLARGAFGVAAPRQDDRRPAPHERLAQFDPRGGGPLLVGPRRGVHEHHVRHRQVQAGLPRARERAARCRCRSRCRRSARGAGASDGRRHQLPRALDDVRARLDRHALVVEEAHRPFEARAVGAVRRARRAARAPSSPPTRS